jgi:allantoinase
MTARGVGERTSPPSGWLSRDLHTGATRRPLLEPGFPDRLHDSSADAPFWDIVDRVDGTRRPIGIVPYAVDSNVVKFWLGCRHESGKACFTDER